MKDFHREQRSDFPWIALDLETDGLSPTRHRIREAALVPFSLEGEERTTVLRFSAKDVLSDHMRREDARFCTTLLGLTKGRIAMAHHAAFDLAFVAERMRRAQQLPFGLQAYCTLRLSRCLLPKVGAYDLRTLALELDLEHRPTHSAAQDARAVGSLFRALAQRFGIRSESDLASIHGPPVRVFLRSSSHPELGGLDGA